MKSTSLARASSRAAGLLLLAVAPLAALETPTASLRFVNATGADAPLAIRLNGEPLQVRGYRSGEATGLLELAAGPCHIELEHPLLGRSTLTLALQPGEGRTVVALAETAHSDTEPRLPPKLASHVFNLTSADARAGRRLQVLQATPLPQLDLRLDGRDLRCGRLRLETLEIRHPQPSLEHAGRRLSRLPFEEAGNGTLILFTDSAGRLRHLFFLDPADTAEELDRT